MDSITLVWDDGDVWTKRWVVQRDTHLCDEDRTIEGTWLTYSDGTAEWVIGDHPEWEEEDARHAGMVNVIFHHYTWPNARGMAESHQFHGAIG